MTSRQALLNTAAGIGVSLNHHDLDVITDPNFSLSVSVDQDAGGLAAAAASGAQFRNRGPDSFSRDEEEDKPRAGDNGEDWGEGVARSPRANDDDSISLSLPASFNDYAHHRNDDDDGDDDDDDGAFYSDTYSDCNEGDGAGNKRQPVGSHRWAPLDLEGRRRGGGAGSFGSVPAGMVATMQEQITTLLGQQRSLEATLSAERLGKAAALAEAEQLRLATERTLTMACSELKQANERLGSQLADTKAVR